MSKALGKARGFAQGGTHAHYAGEFASEGQRRLAKSAEAVRATHAKIGEHAMKIEKAVAAHAVAKITAQKTGAEAKRRLTAMHKSPTAANVKAADVARQRHMIAHAAVFTHQQEIAKHTAAHKSAVTRHALAQALHEDAVRGSTFKPRESKMVDVHERPSFTIGVGRVRAAPPEAPKKESVLDMLSRTRPRYVHQPVQQNRQGITTRDVESRQDSLRRMRSRDDEKLRQYRERGGLESVPGVSAVSLPRFGRDLSRAIDMISLPRMKVVRR